MMSEVLREILPSVDLMRDIESLADAEITEVDQSKDKFNRILEATRPLDMFMKMIHAIDWLNLQDMASLSAVNAWLDGQFGNPVKIIEGGGGGNFTGPDGENFIAIMNEAGAIMRDEKFLNWEIAFPGVWRFWEKEVTGGFDAIIGNPPWDVYEIKEKDWFKNRVHQIRDAQGNKIENAIRILKDRNDPLWLEFKNTKKLVENGRKLIKKGGTSLTLNISGTMDFYKFFVEKSVQLLNPKGLAGLLIPTGIATDKSTSKFFHNRAAGRHIKNIFDLKNNNFFPDVHSFYKFCIFVVSRCREFQKVDCAYLLESVNNLKDKNRRFQLDAHDFEKFNPNTKNSPIFSHTRDANIVKRVYSKIPILSLDGGNIVWPVQYKPLLQMTGDKQKFRTMIQLEGTEGAYHVGQNCYENKDGTWFPLYEGKSVREYDHRASDIIVNRNNPFRPAGQIPVPAKRKANPNEYPVVRFHVMDDGSWWTKSDKWTIAFKDVTALTNSRTMIAAMLPKVGAGHTLPTLPLDNDVDDRAVVASLILGNLNAVPFDYIARQKVQGLHFSWYILEQMPVIPLNIISETKFGGVSARDIISEAVLELTYTAHDMAPFAMDMEYVGDDGKVLPPFEWNESRRRCLKAKIDAVFFILYGIFNPADRKTSQKDIQHIYSTFDIVEEREMEELGRYLSRDLALVYCNSLSAGRPYADPVV